MGAQKKDVLVRMVFFCAGFTPIALLANALVGIMPLHFSRWFLVPVVFVLVGISFRSPRYARLAARGLLAGMLATLIYDATRWPFVASGVWPDFIPKIGAFLKNSAETDVVSGYLWRYLGNGGGMGLAFVMIAPWVASRIGVCKGALMYGTAIWSCLLMTLALCPDAATMMFKLTPLSFVMSLVGHLVYGGVLGILVAKFFLPAGYTPGQQRLDQRFEVGLATR